MPAYVPVIVAVPAGGASKYQTDAHATVNIGAAHLAIANDITKQVSVFDNGKLVRTMPTSMGKDSTPTANGVYIIGGRFKHIIMDSSTYGVPSNSPNGYRTEVDFATQMSYSGIYVHSAPWSVAEQGSSNTSHGCLNVSPENAEWFYNNTKRGDIVEVKSRRRAGNDRPDQWSDSNLVRRAYRGGKPHQERCSSCDCCDNEHTRGVISQYSNGGRSGSARL